MNWLIAYGCILFFAVWEHSRATRLFDWQLRTLILLTVNLAAAVSGSWKSWGLSEAIPMFLLINGLYILTIDDIQTQQMRTIQLYLLILGGVFSAFLCESNGWIGRFLLFAMLFAVLHIFAKRQNSGFGTGDAKVIAALALYLNFSALFQVLFIAFAAGLICGIGLVLLKKATMKTTLPFLPFLLVGVVLNLWM